MRKQLLLNILVCAFAMFVLGAKAQKIVLLTRNDIASGINYAGLDSVLYKDLVAKGYQVTKYYPAGVTAGSATDWTLLNAADLVIVGRNVSSSNFSGVDVASWTSAKVPVIFLSAYVMRSGNLKYVNLNAVTRLATNGTTVSNTLITNANVLDANDPAFKDVTITNGKIDYFKWFYDYLNIAEATFPTTNNGKLLASISADPLYTTTDKKILMARWKPGIETYTGSTIIPTTYRSYIQMGADDNQSGTAKLFNYNQHTASSFQVICNEINYLIAINQKVSFSNIGETKFDVSWKNNSNTPQVVFISANTTGTPTLANNQTYTANAAFGSGTDAGGGWYCVYKGTGKNITVTGLNGNIEYRMFVCDYTGATGAEVYQPVVLPGNPFNQTTLAPKQSQTITFDPISVKYGDAPLPIHASANSGLPVTFSSSNIKIALISHDTLTVINSGSCDIIATQAGNAAYNSTSQTQTILVGKALLTVTPVPATRLRGQSNPVFAFIYTGFLKSDTEDSLAKKPIGVCDANSYSPVGDYDIMPSGGSDNNYDFTYVKGTLTVTSATPVEFLKGKEINIFPNPVSDKLIISMGDIGGKGVVEVYSANGALIAKHTLSGNRIELDLTAYSSGSYVVKVITDKDLVIKQIVKR